MPRRHRSHASPTLRAAIESSNIPEQFAQHQHIGMQAARVLASIHESRVVRGHCLHHSRPVRSRSLQSSPFGVQSEQKAKHVGAHSGPSGTDRNRRHPQSVLLFAQSGLFAAADGVSSRSDVGYRVRCDVHDGAFCRAVHRHDRSQRAHH